MQLLAMCGDPAWCECSATTRWETAPSCQSWRVSWGCPLSGLTVWTTVFRTFEACLHAWPCNGPGRWQLVSHTCTAHGLRTWLQWKLSYFSSTVALEAISSRNFLGWRIMVDCRFTCVCTSGCVGVQWPWKHQIWVEIRLSSTFNVLGWVFIVNRVFFFFFFGGGGVMFH